MYYTLVWIMGLVIGSFLNVCIYRIPREESISYPPSHCGSCEHKLKPLDLVPVFSYLFLKGKCRYCREKISIRYPMIELLNSVLYLLIYLKFGFTLEFFKYCILASLLIVIGIIDYNTQDIYMSTTIFGVVVGIIFIIIQMIFYKTGVMNFMLGGAVGFGVIWLIVFLTKGMGEGDIEIALVCGLFLGIKGILLTLFLAIIIGGIAGVIILALKLKSAKESMAFGPCLAIGAMIAILCGNTILELYIKAI